MFRVVLIGPPGAGKGTQGTLLAKRWSVPHIASGAILRQALATGQGALAHAAQIIKQGNFIPDAVANRIVLAELERPEAGRGFVLDGYPRDVVQAEALNDYLAGHSLTLDAAVVLQIREAALVQRLAGRLTCPQCGESYHVRTAPPAKDGVCDRCGAGLTVREDDQPDRIRTRLALYEEKTEPLVAFYAGRGLLQSVNAEGDEKTVTVAVREALRDALARHDPVWQGEKRHGILR